MEKYKKSNFLTQKLYPLQDLKCKFSEVHNSELLTQPIHSTEHPVVAKCLGDVGL